MSDSELDQSNVLKSVYELIQKRIVEKPEKSYVNYLVDKGLPKILEKVKEESDEVIEAALEEDTEAEFPEHLNYEICDLFFHSLVLAAYKNIDYKDIENELARRFGMSGIEEKESRN